MDSCKDYVQNIEIKNAFYVSLYARIPFYGGPEEGGWWGEDHELKAFQKFDSEEAAEAALERIKKLAERLSKEAKDEFGDQCKRECEWLEERGLDADFLPEVDGEISYYAIIEKTPGLSASEGCRHWE